MSKTDFKPFYDEFVVSIAGVMYKAICDVDWNRYDKQYYYAEDTHVAFVKIPQQGNG